MRGGPPPELSNTLACVYPAGSFLDHGFDGARAESREDIATIGKVEVAETVVHEAAARSEASAAQDIVRTEPRLRVFLVRIRVESRIRKERRRSPLPHAAQQLTQARPAGRGILDCRRRAATMEVERLRIGRRRIAPRKSIGATAIAR